MKYRFKGIEKMGASAISVALLSSPKTAWLLKFRSITDILIEFLIAYLANKGLVILNLGAILVEGEIDQRAFDRAIDQAISEIEVKKGRDKLTPQEIKRIDDQIIKAARNFIVITRNK